VGGRVRWWGEGEKDLAEIHRHIECDSPEAADRLLDAVEDALALLLESPRAGSPREFLSPRAHGMRSWALHGFESYLSFYRVVEDDIEIVRLLHGARDLPHLVEERPVEAFRAAQQHRPDQRPARHDPAVSACARPLTGRAPDGPPPQRANRKSLSSDQAVKR
jgi:toxin ParE1/3/4